MADRSWMFCPTTGALLELDADRNVAWCPVSGHEQDLDGESGEGIGAAAAGGRRRRLASARSLLAPLTMRSTHTHTHSHRAGQRTHRQQDGHGGAGSERAERRGERETRERRGPLPARSSPDPDRAHSKKKTLSFRTPSHQDYRRRYKLEPLVDPAQDAAAVSTARIRSTVDEACVKCGHVGLDFYTMQLRSADEGSTVFYECRACGHKWNQNN